jgi:hypothetical protein
LADANERRDNRIYEEFAKLLMSRARRFYANTQLAMDVDNAVYALDASTIDLTLSFFPWAKYPKRLRRITFRDEEQNRTLVFLTNNFSLSSDTIAALFMARWIKQNLMVKSFYGTSANAVKTQIWISMIVYLILAIMKERFYLENSFSRLLHFLEINLFERKALELIFQFIAKRPKGGREEKYRTYPIETI